MASSGLVDLLKGQKDWNKAVVFDGLGAILAATCKVDPKDINDLVHVFDDRDETISKGFRFAAENYACHRFHDNIAYGRRGDAADGEGIAIVMVEKSSNKKPVFLLATYVLPNLSARVVPQMIEFGNKNLTVL